MNENTAKNNIIKNRHIQNVVLSDMNIVRFSFKESLAATQITALTEHALISTPRQHLNYDILY